MQSVAAARLRYRAASVDDRVAGVVAGSVNFRSATRSVGCSLVVSRSSVGPGWLERAAVQRFSGCFL